VQNSASKVVIVKKLGDVTYSTKHAIELLGGMNQIIKKGDLVLVKPNLVAPRGPYTGTTTDLQVIEEIINKVKDCGGEAILGDATGIEFDADKTFEILKVKVFTKNLKIKFVNFCKDERVKVKIHGGKALKEIKLPKTVLDVDVVVNVPKMKTHNLTFVSLGMKNLFGLLDTEDKRMAHVRGVDQAIVDLNKVIKPHLTIADSIVAMNGDGAVYGDPVQLGVVIAGRDVVSVDIVCCQVMGIDPMTVPHIKLAYQQGLGFGEVKIIGENIENVFKKRFSVRKGSLYRKAYRTMYVMDYLYSRIAKGKTLIPRFIWILGTKPKIDRKKCDKCGICVDVCPVKALNLDKVTIDRKKCMYIRCLSCFEACPRSAIKVKGLSHPHNSSIFTNVNARA